MYKRFPLSLRIFLIMLLVVISTMAAMVFITFYQYINLANEYNMLRLERKEQIIVESFDYLLSKKNTSADMVKERIGNKVYEIADINNIDINFYSLDGRFITGNKNPTPKTEFVPKEIMKNLSINNDCIEVAEKLPGMKEDFTSVYRYIYNNDYQPIAILNLPYFHDDTYLKQDFYTLLYQYLAIVLVVLVISGVFSWFFSRSLMSKIKDLAYRLSDVGALGSRPILYNYIDEISPLIKSYNTMLAKLKEQTNLLVKKEKDNAWQEMARQVAHEIKNPLTPMKLEIQSFQIKFNPEDENIKEKTNTFFKSLIQQIDTIASIATAFSDFAKMPDRKDQKLNIVEVVKTILDIFPSQYVKFDYLEDPIYLNMDQNLLNRILTNLVKNAFQAMPEGRDPLVIIKIRKDEKVVYFFVIDNGGGISEENKARMFTPQFSTKTRGSGLGLAIIKRIIEEDYNGSISFTSEEGVGTVFKFEIPR